MNQVMFWINFTFILYLFKLIKDKAKSASHLVMFIKTTEMLQEVIKPMNAETYTSQDD